MGRFLRKRHVCGRGPPQRQTTAETDRRKDGPLGDRSLPRKSSGYNPRILPQTPPRPSTSEPSPGDRTRRTPGRGTQPTRSLVGEAAPYRGSSEIVPYLGSSSGYNPRFLPQTPPHLSTSEVGRFLRKRHVSRHGPPQRQTTAETDRRKDGPLGDRSLPRKLIRLHPGAPPSQTILSLVGAQTALELPGTFLGRSHLSGRHKALQIVASSDRPL